MIYSLFLLFFFLVRLKALETEPYTQKEAEAAAGMGSYHAPKKKKVTTQPLKEEEKKMDETE